MPPLPIADLQPRMPALLDLLRRLVEHESPTPAKEHLDRLGVFIAGEIERRGARVTRYAQEKAGDHWLGVWGEEKDGILLLTHMDTVHALGSLEHMPWVETADAARGPGVLDMKVSIAMALTALASLESAGKLPAGVSMLCTSDEESGSRSSRRLIEELAARSSLILCLEPALPGGALKTWRKGILGFRLDVHGAAAHAGSDIHNGVNAILEMAHLVQAVTALGDDEQETTVNVGVISGGTRSNVVPQACWARIDVRAKTVAEGDRVLRALRALEPSLEGARLELKGGWNRPPMERDARMQATFFRAVEIGRMLGLELAEGGTGGGSDANFVAQLGIPVLDGLGANGRGAHTHDEMVEVGSLAERTALLAAMISEW